MRVPALLVLLAMAAAPAVAAPTAESLVQEARARARAGSWDVRIERQDDRLLSGLQPGTGPLEASLTCTREAMDLVVRLGGAGGDLLQSRDGLHLAFAGHVRIGPGETAPEPAPGPPPVPEILGYRELTRASAEPVPLHPLLALWPWALRPPLPDERIDPVVAEDLVLGTPCWRVNLTREKVWLRKADLRVLRTEGDGFQTIWSDEGVQVTLGNRPLYRATLREGAPVSPLMLRRPSPPKPPPATRVWEGAALLALAGGLVFLLTRLLRFRLARQACSLELPLLDTPDGLWRPRLERLGFPVTPFALDTASDELRAVGLGLTADTTATTRAIVVAPGMADHAPAWLLRSYVEEGGRVMLLAQTRDLPSAAEMVEIPVPRAIRTDPSGPWRRTSFEEVGPYAAREGSGVYYAQADHDLLVAESDRKGVIAGVVRRGRGEWLLCQLSLRGQVGERVLLDLLEHLQARR